MRASPAKFRSGSSIGIGILLVMAWLSPSFAATHLHSGPERVSVLELYTSQGCSSCPPADQWVGNLSGHPGLWNDFIPLAFHVDYWDYIGWEDRFAQPGFSIRQSRYQDEGGVSALYTPGVVLNGEEWLSWRKTPEPPRSGGDAGLLTAVVDSGATDLRFTPAGHVDDDIVASVAVLGFGLESEIDAGENQGHTLKHDFVVLGLANGRMTKVGEEFVATVGLPSPKTLARRYAVVAWVSSHENQAPLQAAGGWYVR